MRCDADCKSDVFPGVDITDSVFTTLDYNFLGVASLPAVLGGPEIA